MQLEEADDASDSHIQQLEGETAKVQSDDTRNDMAQEASAEGFEKAPAADTARAFELADGLKKSGYPSIRHLDCLQRNEPRFLSTCLCL